MSVLASHLEVGLCAPEFASFGLGRGLHPKADPRFGIPGLILRTTVNIRDLNTNKDWIILWLLRCLFNGTALEERLIFKVSCWAHYI